MDCRTFRKHHLAYFDDTLPGEQLVAAERHRVECEACAAHDTAIRRSLLLARNLPPIDVSPDFSARLAARLEEVRAGRCEVSMDGVPMDDWMPSRGELVRAAFSDAFGTRRRIAVVAASLLALTYAGSQARGWLAPPDVEIPVAAAPTPAPAPFWPALASPALVTSVSTGIPVWPAALLADQAPAHLIEAQFYVASFSQ
jgi:hypothetical protein